MDTTIDKTKKLEGKPVLPTKTKNCGSCVIPMCHCCKIGKAKRLPTKSKTVKIKTDKEGILKDGDLQPGSKVSTDQYTSSLLGRRTHTRGKEPDREKFV